MRDELKLFGEALPPHPNPALCVAKFSRDLDVCLSCRKSFFSRGLTYEMLYGRLVIAAYQRVHQRAMGIGYLKPFRHF